MFPAITDYGYIYMIHANGVRHQGTTYALGGKTISSGRVTVAQPWRLDSFTFRRTIGLFDVIRFETWAGRYLIIPHRPEGV